LAFGGLHFDCCLSVRLRFRRSLQLLGAQFRANKTGQAGQLPEDFPGSFFNENMLSPSVQ
jgi:hypothetical protein